MAVFENDLVGHLDALYNFARWLSGNDADAEDLVQETCLKAIRARALFQPGTNLKAWLYSIMRHAFLDRVRRGPARSGQEGGLLDEEVAVEEVALQGDAELGRLRTLVMGDIAKALQALPERFRAAILLSDVEGLSWEEVAAVLGCPLGTVQSRIYRGRRLLRELLKDYAG